MITDRVNSGNGIDNDNINDDNNDNDDILPISGKENRYFQHSYYPTRKTSGGDFTSTLILRQTTRFTLEADAELVLKV